MSRRTPSPAIGLIRALIAQGHHHQAATSLVRLPVPTPVQASAPTPQPARPARRIRPANTTSSIEQAPPPAPLGPRLIP